VRLKGRQTKQLSDALLDAFPTRNDLEQVVFLGMDTNLERIVGDGPLTHQVSELIVWAQARGRLDELVAAAREANPDNLRLQQLAVDFGSWKT
jgi:internalin A